MTTTDITRPFTTMSARANDIVMSVIIGMLLTGISYTVALWAGWADHVGALEFFAVLTSYISTYLCVKERRFNYVAGAVSSVAYSLLFFQTDLLASGVLNAYLAVALVYGWFRWRKDANTRPVEHVKLRWVPVYIGAVAVAYVGATTLITLLGGHYAFFDAFILAGTILAQFLLDNKKLENWIVWAAVNVVAIYLYFTSGLPLAGFQYIFFLANTVYGFVAWYHSMKRSRAEAAAK